MTSSDLPAPPGSGRRGSGASSRPPLGYGPAARKLRHLLRLGRGLGSAVLVVSGEPGSGRTSLLDQAARRAQANGFRVLQVGLSPICAGRPYGAVIDLFSPLTCDGHLTGRPVLTHRLDALERLFGGMSRRPQPPALDRAAERSRLFTDARRLLRRACARAPLLLVIDDLQWADPSSVALLRDVVVQTAGLPLRLIASVSYAPGEPRSDPFRSLAPVAGRPVPRVDHVELRRRRRMPPLADWVDHTLGGLDPDATEALLVLGAAGGFVEHALLLMIRPAAAALPGIASLDAQGLTEVVDRPGRPGRRARSWLLAEAAYARLTEAERRSLQLRLHFAADRLAPADTAVRAYHAVRAADLLSPDARVAMLVHHAMVAADHAADDTTVIAADAALLAAESASEAVRVAVAPQLLDLRAEALAAIGRPAEAIDSWSAAAELALAGPSTAAARRYRRLAETAWATGRIEEARAHVEAAAGALPQSTPELEHLAVEALRARVRAQVWTGDFADIVAPLAELWRRTGWRGAEVEYKLALAALRPEPVRVWRRPPPTASRRGPAPLPPAESIEVPSTPTEPAPPLPGAPQAGPRADTPRARTPRARTPRARPPQA